MKVRQAWAVLMFAIATQGAAAEVVMKPSAAQEAAAQWAARVLERYRYQPEGQPESAGKPVLEAYLDALDPNRAVFTQEDVAELESYRTGLEKTGGPIELEVPFAIFDWYRKQMAELIVSAKATLSAPMDFTGPARYRRVRIEAPRAANRAALRELWRQRIMDDVLSLRLAGVLETEILPTLERRYDDDLARLKAMTPAQVFERYMNAYSQSLDPHASYRAPLAGNGTGSYLAVADPGIIIRKRADQIEVAGLARTAGSARAAGLQPGDRIVGIAKGPDVPMRSVLGWTLPQVGDLLLGTPATTLVLDVVPRGAPLDGPRTRLSMVRDAGVKRPFVPHGRVETVKRAGAQYRIGVIEVPGFYHDDAAVRAGAAAHASVASDLVRSLDTLKRAQVDAVLLDLRGNTTGALADAVRLAGLFIPGAPVLQQRDFDGKLTVVKAPESALAWDGPLAVLADGGTAAGAETLAAALQDHGRALVLGDPSFGHSTMQAVIDLDRFSQDVRYGELRMTVMQAFRVSGASLEQVGVTPDIELPGDLHASPVIVRSGAILSPPQKALGIKPDGAIAALRPGLAKRHAARAANDAGYQAMLAGRAEALAQRGKDEVSLNEAERRRMRDLPPPPEAWVVQEEEALQLVADYVELARASKP